MTKAKKEKGESGEVTGYEPYIADFGISVFTQEFSIKKEEQEFVQGFSVRYAAPEVAILCKQRTYLIQIKKNK